MIATLMKLRSVLMLALVALISAGADPIVGNPSPTPEDPVLRAMKIELERSKSQLRLEQMAAPYYIEYRVADMEARVADAAFLAGIWPEPSFGTWAGMLNAVPSRVVRNRTILTRRMVKTESCENGECFRGEPRNLTGAGVG